MNFVFEGEGKEKTDCMRRVTQGETQRRQEGRPRTRVQIKGKQEDKKHKRRKKKKTKLTNVGSRIRRRVGTKEEQ